MTQNRLINTQKINESDVTVNPVICSTMWEINPEKIDIIKWTEDLPTLVAESLSPAEIQKVLIDQSNKKIDVILSEENLSKSIGRRGQNVRLASKLINYEIDILTDSEDSERRQKEFKERTVFKMNSFYIRFTMKLTFIYLICWKD